MKLLTLTETANFVHNAQKIIGDDGIAGIQFNLCMNPLTGAVVKGSGGIRKMRWARPGGGEAEIW
jgi:hypothetical protein